MASSVQQRNAAPLPALPQTASPQPAVPKRDAPARDEGKKFADELNAPESKAKPAEAPKQEGRPQEAGKQEGRLQEAGKQEAGKEAKAPDGKAAAAKRTLAPLKQAAATNKQAIDDSPVVNFLTGRLDRLNPGEIPTLVTGNEFLAGALSEADLAAFLGQETQVETLIDDLDLPHALTRDAEMAGLDPNAQLAASDILRAIGVDPQRVLVELTHLKDNMRMEGLTPYMTRAALLGGAVTKGKLKDQLFAEQDPSQRTPAGAVPTTTAPKVNGPALPTFGLDGAGANGAARPGAQQQGMTDPGLLAALMPSALFTPQVPTNPLAGDQVDVSMTGARPKMAMPQSLAADGLALPTDMPLDLGMNLAPAALGDALAASTAPLAAPSMRAATHDPLHALEQKLAKGEVLTIDKGVLAQAPAAGREDVSEALLRGQTSAQGSLGALTGGLSSMAALSTSSLQTPNMQSAAAQPQAGHLAQLVRPVPQHAVAQPRAELPRDVKADVNPFMLDAFQGVKADRSLVSTSTALPVEELRLAMPTTGAPLEALSGEKGDRSGRDFGGNAEQQARDFGGGETNFSLNASDLTRSTSFKAPDAPVFKLDAPTSELAMSPQQRAEFVKQVYDQAVSVARDGGGSVRLDLGSAGLGKLEMAVSVAGDSVDLKILTGSDKMRDAMAGELSRLRDALASQNMTLGKVDVGLEARTQQQHGGFNFNGGQQQAFERQQQMAEMRDQLTTRLRDFAAPARDLPSMSAPFRRPAAVPSSTLALRV